MTDLERSQLMQYLNQLHQRETCPVIQAFPLLKKEGTGPNTLAKESYGSALTRCAPEKGRWIPAKDKLIEYLKREEANGNKLRGCFWTSTFSAIGDDSGQLQRTAINVAVIDGQVRYNMKHLAVTEKCQAVCAEEPTP
jgi:hypothetical protein